MNEIASLDRIRAIQSVGTLEGLYDEAHHLSMTPGWIKREKPILTHEPTVTFAPAHWQYDYVKPALDAASRLVDVHLAERRNLVMCNPASKNRVATTERWSAPIRRSCRVSRRDHIAIHPMRCASSSMQRVRIPSSMARRRQWKPATSC